MRTSRSAQMARATFETEHLTQFVVTEGLVLAALSSRMNLVVKLAVAARPVVKLAARPVVKLAARPVVKNWRRDRW